LSLDPGEHGGAVHSSDGERRASGPPTAPRPLESRDGRWQRNQSSYKQDDTVSGHARHHGIHAPHGSIRDRPKRGQQLNHFAAAEDNGHGGPGPSAPDASNHLGAAQRGREQESDGGQCDVAGRCSFALSPQPEQVFTDIVPVDLLERLADIPDELARIAQVGGHGVGLQALHLKVDSHTPQNVVHGGFQSRASPSRTTLCLQRVQRAGSPCDYATPSWDVRRPTRPPPGQSPRCRAAASSGGTCRIIASSWTDEPG
jgi:hypothetical protein